ncbi:hypothetical protein [Devosia sp.]|uniref:hypothetical protein n=1 Tax=Devosia sp. TaxID=1871048 RepID=UPI003BAA3502
MRIAPIPVLLFVGLFTLPAAAEPLLVTPAQIGEAFCLSRLTGDTGPITGLLTPELTVAIADAEAKNDTIQKQAPDEKPPLGDGIPWQSWTDYADKCTVGAVTLMQNEAKVAIDYAFTEYPEANFTDTLELRLIPGPYDNTLWRLDNIAYATDSDLKTVLISAFLPN